jgi:MFS family permease
MPLTELEAAEAYAEKHARWNYVFNFIDGAAFWLGYAFIAPGVILPLYVSHFTDSKLIIGLVAMIGASGWFLPQLFTANWIERVPVKKEIPVKLGFFTERVPLLILPFMAMISLSAPIGALVGFFLLFAWHSIGSGVVAVAWQDMIAKVIPLRRRGFFLGVTTLGGNATGVVGALLAATLLDRFPFPTGYTINFTIAALLVLISWAALAMVREYPVHNLSPKKSQREYWQQLPGVLRRDSNFRWFLSTQALSSLGAMSWGFMAVYAVERFGLSDGQAGLFTTWLLVGQSIGNLVGGIAVDRLGYKPVIAFAAVATLSALGLASVVQVSAWMALVFFLRGLSLGVGWISSLIVLEFSQPEIRPTYIGINNTLLGVTAMVAPLVGGLIAQAAGYPALFTVSLVLAALSLGVFLLRVKDPRRHPKAG